MNDQDYDPTFPTPPLRYLLRMAAETFAVTLICGVITYSGYLVFLWLQRPEG